MWICIQYEHVEFLKVFPIYLEDHTSYSCLNVSDIDVGNEHFKEYEEFEYIAHKTFGLLVF